MNKPIRVIRRTAGRILRKTLKLVRNPFALLHLCAGSDKVCTSIARSLYMTISQRYSGEESSELAKLLKLKWELSQSTKEIEYVDYGAGMPEDNRTDEEMAKGVMISAPLGELCGQGSSNNQMIRLEFSLVRRLQPERVLELGSFIGISGSAMALGLKLNGKGRLITLEGSESFAEIARENFSCLELPMAEVRIGRFADTLDDALADLGKTDFVYIDGHHDEQATKSYFNTIAPHLSNDAVVLFDDIRWNAGMKRAWRSISRDSRVRISVNLWNMGLVVIGGEGSRKRAAVIFD